MRTCTYTNLDSITYSIWYSLLLLGYKPVQHVTVLNTVGNCNTMISIIILYYNIIILRDHRRICGPSLTETSLCGAYLYYFYIWCLRILHSLKCSTYHVLNLHQNHYPTQNTVNIVSNLMTLCCWLDLCVLQVCYEKYFYKFACFVN